MVMTAFLLLLYYAIRELEAQYAGTMEGQGREGCYRDRVRGVLLCCENMRLGILVLFIIENRLSLFLC